jgi:tetratricopeptide (TPR) repeat protein
MEGPGQLLPHLVASADSVRRFASGARVQTEDLLELESSAPRALRAETLGGILASLEPFRIQPAGLAALASAHDRDLATELLRRASSAKKEREWAAGLGLLEVSRGGADPAFTAAVSYLRAGMKEHALQTVRDLARRRPSEKLPRVLLAHLAMSAGLIGESVRELEAAAAIDPEDARLRLFLSRALFASGNLPTALARNAEAIRLAPALAEAASDRCAMLMAAGDAASAEAACREAVALDGGLAEAHANLGLAHARRGRSSDAEGSYRRALELDPELLDARFNLASLLEREGRAADAIAILRPALPPEALPEAQTLRLAARLSYEEGDLSAARRWLGESLMIEPDNEEAAAIDKMIGP